MPVVMHGRPFNWRTSFTRLSRSSMRKNISSYLRLVIINLLFCLLFSLVPQADAATLHGGSLGERQLPAGSNKVTVTVLDLIDPSPPILISPANTSYVITQRPTFVWQGSTDNNPLSHYQLWIDGKLYIDLIPLGSYETTEYKLVYDKTTRQYSLTLKKNLTEGTHTWKIMVFDMSLNSNSSATWSFTIDSLAPNFVITKIGREAVSISAYDFTTIPTQPIELLENEPQLFGYGEPNSTITLTVTIPGQEGRTYRTTIDKNGYWSIQLNLLPRGKVVDLYFVVEDEAGLITVLSGVQILIKPLFTAGQSSIEPEEPGLGPPRSEYVFGNYWPFADWRPIFTKQTAPIKEIVYSIFNQALDYLPAPLAAALAQIPTQISGIAAPILAWQNVLISSLLPLTAVATVGARFGAELSLKLLAQLLSALNLWPATVALMPPKKGGWLFDATTNQGIAFAKLSLYSLELDRKVDEVVSDLRGYFPGFAYLAKKEKSQEYKHYRIVIEKNGQTLDISQDTQMWPIKTFDSYVYLHNQYKGGVISYNHQKPAPFWLISSQDTKTTASNTIVKIVSYLNGLPFWLLGWELVLCFLVLVFYTSLPNAVVVLYYLALAGSRLVRKLLPNNLSIRLVDAEKQPIAGVKVFCRPIFDPTTLWVRETDQKGFARFALTTPSLLHNNQKDQDYVLRIHDQKHSLFARNCTVEAVKITVGRSPSAEQFQVTSPSQILPSACEL